MPGWGSSVRLHIPPRVTGGQEVPCFFELRSHSLGRSLVTVAWPKLGGGGQV